MLGLLFSCLVAGALALLSFVVRVAAPRAVSSRAAGPGPVARAATPTCHPPARPVAPPIPWRRELAWLGWLCAGLLAVRLYRLDTVPGNVSADEAGFLLATYRALAHPLQGMRGVGWPAYLEAPVVALFGQSYLGPRVASALLSTVALAAFYALARRWLAVAPTLAATTLLGTATWYVTLSRQGAPTLEPTLCLLLAMLCARLATEGRGRWWWLGVALLAPAAPALGRQPPSAPALSQVAALFLRAPLESGGGLAPQGRPLFDVVTAALILVGALRAVMQWRRVGLWWLFFLASLSATQGLARPLNASQGLLLLPLLYLFAGLALERALPTASWPAAALARGAAVALLGGVAVYNLAAYRAWPPGLEAAGGRRPAVAIGEFPAWRALQLAAVAQGRAELAPDQLGTAAAQPSAPAPTFPATPVSLPPPSPPTVLLAFDASGADPGGFKDPRGVAVGPTGEVYVADTGHYRVVKFDAAGHFVTAWGRQGAGDREFLEPVDLTVDGQGRVWVLDAAADALQVFDAQGQWLFRPPDSVGFYHARGITTDPRGNVYVADTGGSRVLQLSPNGAQPLVTFGGRPGAPDLSQPTGVAVDGRGDVYVALPTLQRIARLAPNGALATAWQLPGSETLRAPHAVLSRSGDALYYSLPSLGQVAVLPTAGGTARAWGGAGQAEGQFNAPVGLALDAAGDLLVADSGNNRVQKVRLS